MYDEIMKILDELDDLSFLMMKILNMLLIMKPQLSLQLRLLMMVMQKLNAMTMLNSYRKEEGVKLKQIGKRLFWILQGGAKILLQNFVSILVLISLTKKLT